MFPISKFTLYIFMKYICSPIITGNYNSHDCEVTEAVNLDQFKFRWPSYFFFRCYPPFTKILFHVSEYDMKQNWSID